MRPLGKVVSGTALTLSCFLPLLQRVEDDIYRLLDDLKESKPEAARAEASGLAREFEDIRSYVKENGGQLADEVKAE
jgi:hypothetical protein